MLYGLPLAESSDFPISPVSFLLVHTFQTPLFNHQTLSSGPTPMDKQSQFERVASITSASRQFEPDELELVDLVAPTEEEMNTLRHVPDKVDWSAYSQCIFHISPSEYSPSISLTQFRSDRLC